MSKDRNSHFRQPQNRGGQRPSMPQFAQSVATGQVAAYDRLRQAIKVGHMILQHPQIDPIYEVIQITPVLDPRAGPGLIDLTVTATFKITVPVNQPLPALVIVGDVNAERRRMEEEARAREVDAHTGGEEGEALPTPGAGEGDGEGEGTGPHDGDPTAGKGQGVGDAQPGGANDLGPGEPASGPGPGDADLGSGPRRIAMPGDPDFKS